MPDEPRKTIEELLQASAKARRAEFGSDPTMPNPMRARLHDEVARVGREEEPKPRRAWNWFAVTWPVGTVAAAVLVVAFVMLRLHDLQPPNENRQVAINQRERAKQALRSVPAQVAASTAAESKTEPADALKPDDEKSTGPKTFADVAPAPGQQAFAAAEPKPAVPAPPATFFSQNQKAQGNISQQFSRNQPRLAARASKFKRAINVLDTFQIQQNGDQIRVVDADGSTYTGKIETVSQDALGKSINDQEGGSSAVRSERALQQDSNNQFSFRATGYNTSLKKSVIFEGNYMAIPSQAKTPNESPGGKEEQSPARVTGTARVTGESAIEVDATSVPQ
jgi:hypothetical protein